MLINCPLRSKNEVLPLIEAGADIFYAGLDSDILFESSEGITNRRPWKFANFDSLEDLKYSVTLIHKYGKRIYITINEHYYSESQKEKIYQFISSNEEIDGYIVTSIDLITELKKRFPDIYLITSTGTHILNTSSILFYLNLGVFEMILPRSLQIKELKSITEKFPNVKFECFIKNEDCANIDGLCRYSHGLFIHDKICNACNVMTNFNIFPHQKSLFLDNVKKIDFTDIVNKNVLYRLENYNELMFNECGACFIHDLNNIGVNSIKIVGRSAPLEKKLLDLKFIKKCVMNLDLPRTEFIELTKNDYSNIFGSECTKKCFYNENS